MKIEKSNRLIAEFMGGKLGIDFNTNNEQYIFKITPNLDEEGLKIRFVKYLKYHSSWDWLMPVVKEINKKKITNFVILNDISKGLCEVKVQKVYKAVVDFIKWYNKNK